MAEVKLEDAPQGVQTYYEKGRSALARNNLAYAMDLFEAALKLEPRLLSIRKLLHCGAIKNAKENPPSKMTLLRTLRNYLKASASLKKNPLHTIELTERLLRIHPLCRRFIQLQCEAAERAQCPEISIQTLEILNTNAPSALFALTSLARLYREAARFDDEYACHESILKLVPNDAAALKELKNSAARLTMEKADWKEE